MSQIEIIKKVAQLYLDYEAFEQRTTSLFWQQYSTKGDENDIGLTNSMFFRSTGEVVICDEESRTILRVCKS
jgi:hypothetical protein